MTPRVDVAAACRSWLSVDEAVKHGPGQDEGPPPSADQVHTFATSLLNLVHRFIAAAPATPRAAATGLVTEVEKAARSGNPADMDSTHNPDQNLRLETVETWVRQACGFQNLTVMGADYRFEGLPAQVRPGPASIEFMNHSGHGEMHEIVLLRIKDGAGLTAAALVQALRADPRSAERKYGNDVESVTGAQAPAGQVTYVSTTLKPGHYVAACFIGDPAHVTKGMISTFDVS